MKTFWRCIAPNLPPALAVECAAHGIYEAVQNGGAAEAHTKTTGHPTEITSSAERYAHWSQNPQENP